MVWCVSVPELSSVRFLVRLVRRFAPLAPGDEFAVKMAKVRIYAVPREFLRAFLLWRKRQNTLQRPCLRTVY